MKWLFVLLIAVAQISAISASCIMDNTQREKITSRHQKFLPPSRTSPRYECALERMASDYLNDPAYLLPQTYGLIKGVVEKRSDIDKELDMAFKNHDWGYLKLIERMGIKIPSMYGCYFEEKKWSKPVLACVYDTRVWRSDF